jgi:hypothetical protein
MPVTLLPRAGSWLDSCPPKVNMYQDPSILQEKTLIIRDVSKIQEADQEPTEHQCNVLLW